MFLKNLTTKIVRLSLDKKIFSNLILIVVFWAIFDGTFSYLIPIFFSEIGLTKTQIGLIISTSSLFGATFDFLLSKLFKNTHYRRLFLFFYIFCSIFPIVLWSSSKLLFLSIIAMAIWGLYYDLMNFAIFDFIGNHSKSNNSQRFGMVSIARSVGISIAPILAGALIVNMVTFTPFLIALVFLFISFLFYLVLIKLSLKDTQVTLPLRCRSDFTKEFSIWKKIGFIIFPVLLFNIFISSFDAAFWVIGPIFSQNFPGFKDFGGLFMLMYTIPSLLTCWFVCKINKKFGKKKTAFVAFLIGNIILFPLSIIKAPLLILIVVFFSSLMVSIAWPSMNGAYGDYIYESEKYDREIEGLSDFSTNFGWIIGPIFAGLIADNFSVGSTFSFLAAFNILISIILLIVTPKHINIEIKK
jgi:predicted MFS family arabinose efflux permease